MIALLLALVAATPAMCRADASAARAGEEPTSYRITRLEGAAAVSVVRDGATISLGPGASLLEGDLVVNRAAGTIEVATDDGSTLVLTGDSRLKIESPHGARYVLRLMRGRLYGFVAKVLGASSENGARYRMVIQTRTAAMGVRGTRFVIDDQDPDKGSTFHVLDGVVDVGRSLTGLLSQNFVVASAGQLVAVAGQGFTYVTNGVGQAVDFVGKGAGAAGNVAGVPAEQAKGAVTTATETLDSQVRSVSKALPFDVMGFIANLNEQLPEAFHVPVLTGKERTYTGAESRYHLSSFELYGQGYYARSDVAPGDSSLGLGLSWNPTWHVEPGQYDVRAHIGNSRLFQNGHGLFGDIDFKISATAIFREAVYFELGPLFRHFSGLGEGYGVSASTGLWFGDRKILHLIDRFLFGSDYLASAPTKPLWQLRFGVGFTIF